MGRPSTPPVQLRLLIAGLGFVVSISGLAYGFQTVFLFQEVWVLTWAPFVFGTVTASWSLYLVFALSPRRGPWAWTTGLATVTCLLSVFCLVWAYSLGGAVVPIERVLGPVAPTLSWAAILVLFRASQSRKPGSTL